jgi:hypothetical protein
MHGGIGGGHSGWMAPAELAIKTVGVSPPATSKVGSNPTHAPLGLLFLDTPGHHSMCVIFEFVSATKPATSDVHDSLFLHA